MSIRPQLGIILLLFVSHCASAGNSVSTPSSSGTVQVTIPPIAPGQSLNVHFDNNPIINLNTTNNNSNASHVATSVNTSIQAISHAFSSAHARVSNFLKQHNIQLTKLSPSELAQSAKTFIKLNKKRVAFGSFITIYAATSAALLFDYRYLTRSDLWATWKKHMSVKELQECPQHELQQSLRETILNRYLTQTKSRLNSYMTFMQTVDHENRRINRYIRVAQLVKKSRLMRIFPTNDTKIKRAKQKRKRLSFVKHVFISWAAQQDFEK